MMIFQLWILNLIFNKKNSIDQIPDKRLNNNNYIQFKIVDIVISPKKI